MSKHNKHDRCHKDVCTPSQKHFEHESHHKDICTTDQKHKDDCKKPRRYSKLSPLALALAAGSIHGFGVLFLGWAAANQHWGLAMVQVIGSVYKGFGATMTGALWGGVWGFMDGFISGLIFAWLYNLCACCAICRCKK